MIKVSVIIPCYNQAAFLPKAVASLQAQTLGNWECIIIDDGSKDNTTEVASNISLQEPRVRLIQQANGGSACARDTGIQIASGQFIQFLDADDTIDPEKLERQVAFMEQKGLDISYTAFCREENHGLRTKPRSTVLSLCTVLTQWGLGASTPIHSFMYRMDFIRLHHLAFHSACRFREDWKWHITCFMTRPKQAALPDYCGAIYYQNEQGKTGSYIKVQEGNFTFMAYMNQQLHGFSKCLWLFRISEELWIWLLRMTKYRSTACLKTIAPLVLQTGNMLAAILMMPIALIWIVIYFIKIYIK